MQSFKQGVFDGLCGYYSIINAIHYIKSLRTKRAEKLLLTLVNHKPRLFNHRYTEGTYFDDVISLINIIKKEKGLTRLQYNTPFEDDYFDCIEEYVACLNEQLNGLGKIAIISIGSPWHHWTVVPKVDLNKERIEIFDSFYDRKYLSFDELALKRKRDKLEINTDETIILTIR